MEDGDSIAKLKIRLQYGKASISTMLICPRQTANDSRNAYYCDLYLKDSDN